MDGIKALATTRDWCVLCPDLVLEGEVTITYRILGLPSVAHADCAEATGFTATEDRTGGRTTKHLDRLALREYIREHGCIDIELP